MAVVAGRFGASRLAALDAHGRVLAWDGRPGYGGTVAVCPGGAAVAAVARSDGRDAAARRGQDWSAGDADALELTVHDARTLRTVSAVALPVEGISFDAEVAALRCADRRGARVDVLVREHPGSVTERLRRFVVADGRATESEVGVFEDPVVAGDGFLGRAGASVVRLGPDGSRHRVATLAGRSSGFGLAASPDGRTVAVHREHRGRGEVVTLDARTGRRLGRWATAEDERVFGAAWTGSGRLLLRTYVPAENAPPQLRTFDRKLRNLGPRAAPAGNGLTVVGDAVVTYGYGRLMATAPSGRPLVADELLLAAAENLAGLPGAAFAPGGPPAERVPLRAVLTGPPPRDLAPLFTVVLGLLAAAAVVRIVRRSWPGARDDLGAGCGRSVSSGP